MDCPPLSESTHEDVSECGETVGYVKEQQWN